MSRIDEIDSFIRYYASVYSSNPNLEINADTFYYGLMSYGYTQEEMDFGLIKSKFDSWTRRYSNSKNLNVYEDSRQENFLQFRSKQHNPGGEYKLYLSFPEDKIEQCVNILFDFIDRNNIDSGSKVAYRVRSDSVVLRLGNSVDVAKVLDFVNKTPEIFSNARATNPFVMRYGVVGMAYDDGISYNSVVTMILEAYFKEKSKTSTLSQVSYQDLCDFALTYHQSLFTDPKKLDEFTKHPKFLHGRHQDIGYALTNYEQVIRLACSALLGDFGFEQYKGYVEESNKLDDRREYASYYREYVKSAYPFQYTNGYVQEQAQVNIEVKDNTSAKALLDEYITYAIEKYGKEGVSPYLHHFMRGHIEGITKDKAFRQRFAHNLNGPLINEITEGNIDSYIQRFHSNKNSIEAFDIVYQACVETYKKYGYGQLYGAIKKASMGNYSSFTNGEAKLRDKLYTSVTPDEFMKICEEIAKRHGYNTQFSEEAYLHCADAIAAQISRTQSISQQNIKQF